MIPKDMLEILLIWSMSKGKWRMAAKKYLSDINFIPWAIDSFIKCMLSKDTCSFKRKQWMFQRDCFKFLASKYKIELSINDLWLFDVYLWIAFTYCLLICENPPLINYSTNKYIFLSVNNSISKYLLYVFI